MSCKVIGYSWLLTGPAVSDCSKGHNRVPGAALPRVILGADEAPEHVEI